MQLLDLGLDEYLDALAAVSDAASRENRIEIMLAEMVAEWSVHTVSFKPYKQTGLFSLTGVALMLLRVAVAALTARLCFRRFGGRHSSNYR
jgi:hypothetical protein